RRDHHCVERHWMARSPDLDAVHCARHRENDARDLFLGHLHLRTAQSDRTRRLLTRAVGPCQCLRADPATVPPPDPRARRHRSLPAVGVHRDSGCAHSAALLINQQKSPAALLRTSASLPPPKWARQKAWFLPAAQRHPLGARKCEHALASASLLRNTLLRLTPQRKSEHRARGRACSWRACSTAVRRSLRRPLTKKP